MEARTQNPMRGLYRCLKEAGIPRPYVRKALPTWWDDDVATTPAGYTEAIVFVSRHLGLDPKSLRNEEVRWKHPENDWKLKKARNVQASDTRLACTIATQLVHIVTQAMSTQPGEVEPNGVTVRQKILSGNQPWVSLESLLAFCWEHGIAVIHAPNLPPPKPHGMAVMSNGRPAIVVFRSNSNQAWLLFDVAHELGHIASGHLRNTTAIIDEVEAETDCQDVEENEANLFALNVLCGQSNHLTINTLSRASQLARLAREFSARTKIDPGHALLNAAKTERERGRNIYPLVSKALALLGPSVSGQALISRYLSQSVEWDALTDDAAEYVSKMTNAPTELQ